MSEPRGPVLITKKEDVGKESTGQTNGMVRKVRLCRSTCNLNIGSRLYPT